MTRVKVCGITSVKDAVIAYEAGADAIGFLFSESPRKVQPDRARTIVQGVPPFITAVGVFVNEPLELVREVIERVGLGAVQLHGDEPPGFVDALSERIAVIKAFRVRGREAIAASDAFSGASAFLFDAYVKGSRGGTGHVFNWRLLSPESTTVEKPWILAGGLTRENIHEALRLCRPIAVDVSSGVERAPGVKDEKKVFEFIGKVRQFDYEQNRVLR